MLKDNRTPREKCAGDFGTFQGKYDVLLRNHDEKLAEMFFEDAEDLFQDYLDIVTELERCKC